MIVKRSGAAVSDKTVVTITVTGKGLFVNQTRQEKVKRGDFLYRVCLPEIGSEDEIIGLINKR